MPTLWTIGHSNRSLADFLALLAENHIESIADVRLLPGSRRHPQFDQDSLAASLAGALSGTVPIFGAEKMGTVPLSSSGITYIHFRALGGRRKVRPRPLEERGLLSPNSAWRVEAFAAYADYMLTPEFKAAFADLKTLAATSRTAIMCAEALPWRCHRRLIADQFIAAGWQVLDIIGPNNTKPHELPPFAKIVNGQVTYPGDPTLFN